VAKGDILAPYISNGSIFWQSETNLTEPERTDKAHADILEGINELKSLFSRDLSAIDRRMSKLENALRQVRPDLVMKHESTIEEDMKPIHASPSPVAAPLEDSYSSSPGDTVQEPQMTVAEAIATVREMEDSGMEVEPGPPVPPGEPAIPVNHTTLAGLLLTWPSIKEMVGHILNEQHIQIRYPSEFPIRQEQERGLLRLFGRGEGSDSRPTDKDAYLDHGVIDMPDNEDYSDISSPSPGGEWGQLGGLSPPPTVDLKGATLGRDGNPDFSKSKVDQYVTSFQDNMLNMHPIITRKELRAMVKIFLGEIPPSGSKPAPPAAVAKFVQPTSEPVMAGMKRKHSPAAEITEPATVATKPGKPNRTINNALVLIILALGKICLHRDNVPDVLHEEQPAVHNSPMNRNGHPASPSQTSPPAYSSHSQSSGLHSPKEADRSRRPSVVNTMPMAKPPHSLKKNYDVIPGLEYFAYATDILGNQLAGTSMKHVYAFILAGLYYGQLGRVMESWSHIATASRTLQVILRP
jgi:hypothetical protein